MSSGFTPSPVPPVPLQSFAHAPVGPPRQPNTASSSSTALAVRACAQRPAVAAAVSARAPPAPAPAPAPVPACRLQRACVAAGVCVSPRPAVCAVAVCAAAATATAALQALRRGAMAPHPAPATPITTTMPASVAPQRYTAVVVSRPHSTSSANRQQVAGHPLTGTYEPCAMPPLCATDAVLPCARRGCGCVDCHLPIWCVRPHSCGPASRERAAPTSVVRVRQARVLQALVSFDHVDTPESR